MSSELPGGGATAGKLNVPVVGDYTGFRESLKAHITEAARGLSAKVNVEVSGEGLRERLEAVVQEAAAGVSATVAVKVDRKQVRSALTAAVNDVSSKIDPVKVGTAENAAGGGMRGWFGRLLTRGQAEADKKPVKVAVTESRRRGGFLSSLRNTLTRGQAEADKKPVKVGFTSPKSGKGSLSTLVKLGLASLVQPAVGILGQSGAGLFSLAGSVGSSVQILGAIPALIAAAATAMVGGKAALSGFTAGVGALIQKQKALADGTELSAAQQQQFDAAIKNLTPSARDAARAIASVIPRFTALRKSVQEAFFSKFADQIKPVITNLLPVLKTQLTETGSVLGTVIAKFAKWAKSPAFSRDTTKIMSGSNVLLKGFGRAVLGVAKAFDNLAVAAQPFIKSLDPTLAKFGKWAEAWSANERASGRFAATLEHARVAADAVGRSLRALYDGFGALFGAAMPAGDSLLADMTTRLQTWAKTMQSAREQGKLSALFDDSSGTLRQVAGLIGDIGRGIGHIIETQGFSDMVAGLRTSLLPALGHIIETLGQAGPDVLKLIGSAATLISKLAGATPALRLVLRILNGVLEAINGVISHVPILGEALGALFGARLLLNVGKFAVGLLGIEKTMGRISTIKRGSMLATLFGGFGGKAGAARSAEARFGPELGGLALGAGASKVGLLARLKGLFGIGAAAGEGGALAGLLSGPGIVGGIGAVVGAKTAAGGNGSSGVGRQALSTGELAASGAAIGSVVPGVGTAVGAGVGAAAALAINNRRAIQNAFSNPSLQDVLNAHPVAVLAHGTARTTVAQALPLVRSALAHVNEQGYQALVALGKKIPAVSQALNQLSRAYEGVGADTRNYLKEGKAAQIQFGTLAGVVSRVGSKLLTGSSAAAQANRQTLSTAAKSLKAYGAELVRQGVPQDQANKKVRDMAVALRKQAIEVYGSKTAVDKLLGSLDALPGDTKVKVSAQTQAARTALNQLLVLRQRLAADVVMHVITAQTSANVDRQNRADGSAPAPTPKHKHSLGGLIRGAGTAISDSIPTWLSDNEFVIRAASVKRLGVNFLNRLNDYADVGKAWAASAGVAAGGRIRAGAGALAAGMSGTGRLDDLTKVLHVPTSPHDLVPGGHGRNGPLVGGNLVLSTVPTDPRTALQAAVFELRRLSFGGVYAHG